MQILLAQDISKYYGVTRALRTISLRVSSGDRIGVVGPNGIGKSTLLRILAGIERPDEGRVKIADGSRVGYVPQELALEANDTLCTYLARQAGVRAAEVEIESLAVRLDEGLAVIESYSRALDQLALFGGEAFDSHCRSVCRVLGLEAALDRPIGIMSGGDMARVRLAAVMLARFDVLLLDEPTNDLDFEGLARLERVVRQTPSAVVVVSHDRAFLQATTTRIIAFEKETGVSREYEGGYAEFERRSAVERATAEERYRRWANEHDRQTELRSLRRTEARAAGRQASRRATRASASKVRAANRALVRLEHEKVDKPWRAWQLRLSLAPSERTGDTLVRLKGAVAGCDRFSLGPVNLEVGWRERILITGPNGSGKSMLLKMILGTLPLACGSRWVGPRVTMASLDQQRELFTQATTLVDLLRASGGLDETDARTLLGHFNLLEENVLRPARSLSPGERTRAGLALLQASRASCLVLDEPSNHLDHEGIEQLESALANFAGTVLLVTHDRRLLANFASSRTVTLTKDGPREA